MPTADGAKPRTDWRGVRLPEPGWPVGYAWLIEQHNLAIPSPPRLAMVAKRHEPEESADWQVHSRRRMPDSTTAAQLEFALKYEGVSLAVMSALFQSVSPAIIADMVREKPTGTYTRRVWFLYEWLMGQQLELLDAVTVKATPAVDPIQQVARTDGDLSTRHRVLNNLPGTPAFCPMVRWTEKLSTFVTSDLQGQAKELLRRVHPDIIRRTAAFLLLKDSRASFRIEGESPSLSRAQRWATAIAEAGASPLTVDDLVRLQRIVIGDSRFVHLGLREDAGFVGMHDRVTQEPIPDHISAKPGDLESLMAGLVGYEQRATQDGVDPVIGAAVVAFGFGYIHPFEDGNGRIHRWLIHHLLARGGFSKPGGVVFPVSSSILKNIDSYRAVLESYSKPLLNYIEWKPTDRGNVNVLNETADYYRFFDATAHAEFLYERVRDTITKELPDEIAYLQSYDRFAERVEGMLDMPARTIELLHHFLRQNEGKLSKRAREKEFKALTEEEVGRIEELYSSAWES